MIADYFVSERHHFLLDTIGTLDIENAAYDQAWIFSWIFFVIVIVCSVMQYLFFHLYNEKFHPMAPILEEYLKKGIVNFHESNKYFTAGVHKLSLNLFQLKVTMLMRIAKIQNMQHGWQKTVKIHAAFAMVRIFICTPSWFHYYQCLN